MEFINRIKKESYPNILQEYKIERGPMTASVMSNTEEASKMSTRELNNEINDLIDLINGGGFSENEVAEMKQRAIDFANIVLRRSKR